MKNDALPPLWLFADGQVWSRNRDLGEELDIPYEFAYLSGEPILVAGDAARGEQPSSEDLPCNQS